MTQPPATDQTEVEKKLGLQAVDQLCDSGCERVKLLGLLEWMAAYKPLRIATYVRKADGTIKKRTVKLDLRSLDSRATAHPEFALRDLDRIARAAKRLRAQVANLRKTPLVQKLVDQGIIGPGDLLATSPIFPSEGSGFFRGLIILPKAARQCGPQKKPDYTKARRRVHEYIYAQTGSWQDRSFALIHNYLFPRDQLDEKDVQRWRSRHGLIDPQRKTRKRRKVRCC